jgi:hypothetical protein
MLASRPDKAVTGPYVLDTVRSSSSGDGFAVASVDPAVGVSFIWIAACTEGSLYNDGHLAHTQIGPAPAFLSNSCARAVFGKLGMKFAGLWRLIRTSRRHVRVNLGF